VGSTLEMAATEAAAEAGRAPSLHPRERAVSAERVIGQVLRVGAVCSGAMFVGSLALEPWSVSAGVGEWIEGLRRGGVALLVGTPVARLAVAGVSFGRKREWRYTAYAGSILVVLAVAVGLGLRG
jgi:uncharacterized membrane protein